MKTICYFGHDWAGNIGNAFIDKTIKYCIKLAMKEEPFIINEASNLPAYLKYNFAKRKPFCWLNTDVSSFDLRQLMKPDSVILGAALLDAYWSKVHKDLLDYLADSQIKTIILGGGGGNSYSREEVEYVKTYWKKINVWGFIARDERAYDNFKDLSHNSYLGIDNAFFLKDSFTPAQLSIEHLGIKTFDLTFSRKIYFPEGFTVINLRHRLLDVDSIKFALRHGWNTYKIVEECDLLSDFPDDYLHLYGNSEITHSDRVHACVATLSFGGKAQYYDNSDRSYLFDRVGLTDIKRNPVSLNQAYISEEKRKQIDYLRRLLFA